MWGSVETIRRQKGPAKINVWETLIRTTRISNTGKGMRNFYSVNRPYRPWGPPAYFSIGSVVLSWDVNGRGLTNPQLNLASRLQMRGAILLIPRICLQARKQANLHAHFWYTYSVLLTGHAWLAVNRTWIQYRTFMALGIAQFNSEHQPLANGKQNVEVPASSILGLPTAIVSVWLLVKTKQQGALNLSMLCNLSFIWLFYCRAEWRSSKQFFEILPFWLFIILFH
jgi:hypothetical protein